MVNEDFDKRCLAHLKSLPKERIVSRYKFEGKVLSSLSNLYPLSKAYFRQVMEERNNAVKKFDKELVEFMESLPADQINARTKYKDKVLGNYVFKTTLYPLSSQYWTVLESKKRGFANVEEFLKFKEEEKQYEQRDEELLAFLKQNENSSNISRLQWKQSIVKDLMRASHLYPKSSAFYRQAILKHEGQQFKSVLTKEILEKLLKEEKRRVLEVAKEYGCTDSTIYQLCKKYEIKL